MNQDKLLELIDEYYTLYAAEMLDDVDCSPSTMDFRNRRLDVLEELFPGEILEQIRDIAYYLVCQTPVLHLVFLILIIKNSSRVGKHR